MIGDSSTNARRDTRNLRSGHATSNPHANFNPEPSNASQIGIAFQLAEAAFDRHDYVVAIDNYSRVLKIDTNHRAARVHRGLCHKASGRLDLAEADFQTALEQSPKLVAALINLGVVQSLQGRNEKAIDSLSQATRMSPQSVAAYTNLGRVLKETGHAEDARECFERALAIEPECLDARINLGGLLNDLGFYRDATTHLRAAIVRTSVRADAHYNLAISLHHLGILEEAIAEFNRAIELDPDYLEARYNRALVQLLRGQVDQGWNGYELRNQLYELRPNQFEAPQWDGSSLAEKTILVAAEQGVGEEILFSTCLPDVVREAKHCLLECDARLKPLMARSFPSCQVFSRPRTGDSTPEIWLPPFDCRIGLGSLPRFFRPSLRSFPRRQQLLQPNPRLCEKWRSRFDRFKTRFKVGISWRGGLDAITKRRKSIRLSDWLPILSIPGVEFINLQYGDVAQELSDLRKTSGITVHHWNDADPTLDLDDFAAQVASLDLVISISNTTVHMAGALGVPVWTLIPHVPDWRWQMGRDDSIWYGSMRLIRQNSNEGWTATIRSVANALESHRGSIQPQQHAA